MKKANILSKVLSIVLCITIIATSVRLESFASTTSSMNTETKEELSTAQEMSKPYIVAEIKEERTETTKTFRMSDGSYTIAAYDQPIHFKNQQGKFEEVDNTFTTTASDTSLALQNNTNKNAYTNRAGKTKIRIANQISMDVAGQSVSWFYEGISSGNIEWKEGRRESELIGDDKFLTVETGTSLGELKDAFPYTDLQYFISPEGIKENIILKDKRANNSWTLQVNIGTLIPIQKDAQTIELYGNSKEAVMVISAPLMHDSSNQISTDVVLNMSVKGSEMSLQVIADDTFLKDENTVYPVTVDPYFYVISSSAISISDTFLSSYKPSTNMRSSGMAAGSLMVGRESSAYGKTRSLLKLNTLPALPAGSVITEANLILKNYYSYSANKSMVVEVRKATGNWTTNGATWNNSNALYENQIQDYAVVPQNESPSNLFNTWEITRLMRGWYEGTIPNYGLMLTALSAETASAATCTKYYSSNSPSYQGLYPTFIITFRNNAGLENYWTYHSQSVSGGTGYINDYSGNLVFTVPIAETTGANMPIQYSFVYNGYSSNQQYRNQAKGSINGFGWMTSFSQRLDHINNMPEYSSIASELVAQGFEYVWLDHDGTHHFLKKQNDGTYQDEDGLGLTMRTGQTYESHTNVNVIEDKSGNKTGFLSTGYIIYDRNHLNQEIKYTYNGLNLASVTDGAGRQIAFNCSSYFITRAVAPDDIVTFEYQNNNLSKICFSDGTTMEFGYTVLTMNGTTHHLLSSVKGRDGTKLVYEYATTGTLQQRCRVQKVTEYATDGTLGNALSMDYSLQNSTKFTYTKDSGTISETYQFNDWGHTTNAVGPDGSSSYIRYNTNAGGALNNKLAIANPIQKSVNNLVTDPSIEDGYNWGSFAESGTNIQFTHDSTTAYLGYKSLKVQQNSTVPKSGSVRKPINITGGKTYTFSVYAKTADVTGGTQGVGVWVYLFSGNTALNRPICKRFLTGNNDWQRISVSFTAPSNATLAYPCAGIMGANGTAWFDCFQFEESETPSLYNLVENSSFDTNRKWSYTAADGSAKLTGVPTGNVNVFQTVPIGKQGVAFEMSASIKAVAAPIISNSARIAGICIQTNYTDGTHDSHHANINTDVSEWQNVNLSVAPKYGNENKTIDRIYVFLLYYQQVNTVYMDNVVVNLDETGTTYAYDSKGNLLTSKDNAKRQTTYTIDNATNMVTTMTDSTNTVYAYTYDSVNKKQLVSAKENSTGVGYEYTYGTGNNINNVETVRMGTVGSMTAGKYVEIGTTYTENGAYVSSTTDQRGKATNYQVDTATGRVQSVTDSLGNTITYTYHPTTKNLSTVTSGESTVTYGYSDASLGNRLESITRNLSTYTFLYDKWQNLQSTKIGNRTLVTNVYVNNNGNLQSSTYGNGHILEYEYDQYDRLIAKKETVDSTTETQYTARYFYNSNGLLARVSDEINGRVTDYTYDLSDRLIVYQNPSGYLLFGYDNQDRTSKITTKFNGNQYVTNYAYLSANRPGVTTFPIGKIDRTYDSLQREAVHQVYANANSDRHLRGESVYLDVEGNRTTQLISQYNHYVGTSDSVKDVLGGYTSFTYTYDDNGNISSITEKAGSSTRLKTYEYDTLNQLIRENDESQGKTYTYTYDNGGNLLEKRTYAYTTGTLGEVLDSVLYTYGDTEWRDLLTAYDGQSITYDGIGNPLTYRNGLQFTWSQGRRLAQATLSDGRVVNYTYNEQGIRIGKTVGETQTEYFVDDSGRMYGMKQGEETLIFLYDSTGRLEGFRWLTGTTDHGEYYYVYNIQGDVIGIVANDLTLVVEYEYDSWGKVLNVSGSMSSTIGELNPIRYRGYCYDAETGFYATGTRYYDPVVARFISPDTIAVLTATPMGLTDKNLYAYCDNNPIVRVDRGGQFWESAFDVISLGASVVEVCVNPTDIWAWAGLVGDAVDLIPFLTGVGEATRAIKTTVKVVNKSDDVLDAANTLYKTADVASDIRKASGSYEILYKSGKNYIGKGNFKRALSSAKAHAEGIDDILSIRWKSAPSTREAFIDEYLMQKRYGGVLSKNKDLLTYNKIWSPGRRYYGR